MAAVRPNDSTPSGAHFLARIRRPARAVALLLLCASCASSIGTLETDSRYDRLFTAGYANLNERYIDEISMSRIVTDGLRGLAQFDNTISVEHGSGQIRILNGDHAIGAWSEPDSRNVRAWAKLTVVAMTAARENSTKLAERDPKDLADAILAGAVSGLDRYTRYSSPDAARNNRASRDGFGGIGISIRQENGITEVQAVHTNTPAERAGLKKGDIITRVDGADINGLEQNEIVKKLRGRVDSKVQLDVIRAPERAQIQVSVVRSLIVLPTVVANTEDGILSLRVSGFNQGTAYEASRIIRDAERELGKDLRGIIMDLRGNPGGLLDQAVSLSDLFLGEGLIITTEGRHPESHQTFMSRWGQLAQDLPLVVVVNGRSASAAEIVAAALQDRGRAVLVGSTSYGKGVVQTIVTLPNDAELTFTWAVLHSPSGNAWHGHGVVPTICTNDTGRFGGIAREAAATADHDAAVKLLVRARDDFARAASAEGGRVSCAPSNEEPAGDLEVARKLIRDRSLYDQVRHGPARRVAATQGPTAVMTP
jgi:carboxyl-terminal processing protease